MSLIDVTLSTGYREWMEEALCLQFPADWWHSDSQEETWQARRLCRQCPVAAKCLQHALDNDEQEGIWAATTPRERRKIAQGKTPCHKNHPGEPTEASPRPSGEFRCRACDRVTTRNRRAA